MKFLKKTNLFLLLLFIVTSLNSEEISIKNNSFNIDFSKLETQLGKINSLKNYKSNKINQNNIFPIPTYLGRTTINPTTITSGCGTIQANQDEILKILSSVFTKAMNSIGNYSINAITGYADSNNPKQVFLRQYDVATTMVCMGESIKVEVPETLIWMPFANYKHKRSTLKDKSEDAGKKTQINRMCGDKNKNPDEEKDVKKAGENKNGDEQANGDIKRKSMLSTSQKFKECKERYIEYYDYIEEKIDRYYALDRKKEDEIKGSCEVIKLKAKQKYKTDGKFISPIYASNIVPERITLTGIVESSLNIKTPTKRDYNYNVKREEIKDSLLIHKEFNKYKREDQVKLDKKVYNIGIEYANMLTTCLNGFNSSSSNGFNIRTNNYSLCSFMDSEDGNVFQYDLRPKNKKGISDFKNKLKTKEEFCRINEFRESDTDFIISTIGYVTKDIINERKGDILYTISDLKSAIKEVIIKDWCGIKLEKEKRELKDLLKRRVSELRRSVDNRDIGLLIKQPFLTSNELWYSENGDSDEPSIYKICTKSSGQENIWYAKIDKKDKDSKMSVTIHVKKANIDDLNFVKKSEGYYSKYETEMFCNGSKTKEGSICKNLETLRCGINWDKKNNRSDSLYYSNSSKEGNNKLKEDKYNDKGFRLETRNGETGDWYLYKEIILDKGSKTYPTKENFEKEIAMSLRMDYRKMLKARKVASKYEHLIIDQIESNID
jgi:hypothetical protein